MLLRNYFLGFSGPRVILLTDTLFQYRKAQRENDKWP